MGFNSFWDLELAGVKWELSDNKKTDDCDNYKNQPVMGIKNDSLSTVSPRPFAPITECTAKTDAINANDLPALYTAIEQFNHPLKMFAKNTILPVVGEKLLVLTDTPSSDDDESGKILSGAAGDFFDKMIGAIGFNRDNISICPLIFWRTPGGRTPTDEEILLARPFVNKFIELIRPNAILTLGSLSAKHELQGDNLVPRFSIPSPEFMILKPDSKKTAWEELQKLLKNLE